MPESAVGTSSNVDIGPGWLWCAPIGTTEPTDASTALPSAWRQVGYTDTGHAFESQVTSEDIEVAEELEPIDIRETKRTTTWTFDMAEVNRQNLALAMNAGANAVNDASAFDPPALGSSLYVMLVHESMATPDGNNVRWILRKCKQIGNSQIQRRKAPQKALIPVQFRVVKPDSLQPWRVFPNAAGLIA